MEIKLNKKEILTLIKEMGGVAIKLTNKSIGVIIINQKYVKFLMKLSIDDLKFIADYYIKSVAKTFDYKDCVEYTFAFDSIIIASKIDNVEKYYINKLDLNQEEIFDNRYIDSDVYYTAEEYNEEYDDTYDDYHCDNDYSYIDPDKE